MKILNTVKDVQIFLKDRRKLGSIGFVPTMGALHRGHMSLVEKSVENNDFTVVSIFTNPTQFNDPEDLKNYPVTLKQDLDLLREAGVDMVFTPSPEEIYPDHFNFKLSESEISNTLCGKDRPGHFTGVLTVVLKLFNIVKPQRAYFGEKDFQQLTLIKKMTEALFLEIEIVPCPTVRAENGLALSSRNNLLNENDRAKAALLNKALNEFESEKDVEARLSSNGFEVDYVEFKEHKKFVAAKLSGVRLIDNV